MDQDTKIRVLIVDDHDLFREGLAHILADFDDIWIVEGCQSGEEALERLDALRGAIDVVLMDIDMPGKGGVVITKQIQKQWPKCGVILLTAFDKFAYAGISAGAQGYLLKNASGKDIANAIRIVHKGGVFLHPDIQKNLVNLMKNDMRDTITDRELRVLEGIANGESDEEIGNSLGLSRESVRQYVHTIVQKFNASGRAHAVAIALRQGLVR
ncbi:MAG: response regulator transcription factor [Roseiflexaceae bacterium]